MKRLMVVSTMIILLVAACGPRIPSTPPLATPPSEPAQTSSPIPVDQTPSQRAAIQALAKSLGISPDQVAVVSSEAVQWPDGCLGVQRIGVMCNQLVTPGFRIVLAANGNQYELHTNQDGSVVVPGQPFLASDQAIGVARKQLSTMLGIPEAGINLVRVTMVEWPDSCLGISQPYVMCAQMVTSGYLIALDAGGQQYEYHTNQDGSSIVPASLALTWQREGGIAGFCDSLEIYLSGEVYSSSCKAGWTMESLGQVLSAAQLAQFKDWMTQYGRVNLDESTPPGTADGMQIKLSLNGTGDQQPTQAEQQAMQDWAQAVYNQLNQAQ
jgi:hypothetical protein